MDLPIFLRTLYILSRAHERPAWFQLVNVLPGSRSIEYQTARMTPVIQSMTDGLHYGVRCVNSVKQANSVTANVAIWGQVMMT